MRVQGADQLAVLALRPQRRVDLEERVGGEPHHLAGDPGGDRVGVLADEDDVDVADVVQFARAALAHRDDGEPRRLVSSLQTDRRSRRSARRPARRRRGRRGAHRRSVNGSTGSFSTVGARSSAGQHQQPVAVELAQRGIAAFVPQSAVSATQSAKRVAAVRAAEGSVTVCPASRCQDCGWATRWSPSASDEPSTPNSRPRRPWSFSRAR